MHVFDISAATLARCEAIARKYHAGQFRRDGVTPYITHPERVSSMAKSNLAKAVAFLHDTIEDTNATVADLIIAGVPQRVVDAVLALTKLPHEPYETYLVLVKMDPLALEVKILDIKDNLNDQPTPKQIEKYAKALKFLTS
jgi:(p)ppGpp synthase/HD superfamily hydrolase